MEKNNSTEQHKKTLRRKDVSRLHRTGKWAEEAHQYREEDQRALQALQYQNEPIEQTLQGLERKMGIRQKGNPSRISRLPVRLALAASLLLAVVAGYFTFGHIQQDERLFEEHFAYIPSSIQVKGIERNVTQQQASLLATAVQAYESGRYKNAEGLFRAYLAQDEDNNEVRFYYALLQLGKGNAGIAIPILEEIEHHPPREGYERAAKWYLGLAQLKLSKRDEAALYFEALESGNDRFAKNARALLADMR